MKGKDRFNEVFEMPDGLPERRVDGVDEFKLLRKKCQQT
jgi:hypothetical protein